MKRDLFFGLLAAVSEDFGLPIIVISPGEQTDDIAPGWASLYTDNCVLQWGQTDAEGVASFLIPMQGEPKILRAEPIIQTIFPPAFKHASEDQIILSAPCYFMLIGQRFPLQ